MSVERLRPYIISMMAQNIHSFYVLVARKLINKKNYQLAHIAAMALDSGYWLEMILGVFIVGEPLKTMAWY